jgi:hypothetical protein
MQCLRSSRRPGFAAAAALIVCVIINPAPSFAQSYPAPASAGPGGQPFVPSVVAAYHSLARRAEPLAALRTLGHQATDCKHQEGLTRHDAADGTPYVFVSKSGLDPGVVCFVDDEPGYFSVIQMGSRKKNGERMRSNLAPLDGSPLVTRPHIASGEDVVVQSIPLDGAHGFPAYRHPGGMQAIGDLLVIGTENPFQGGAGHTVLFVNVAEPWNPQYIGQLDIENPGDEAGADPVGLTVVKDGAGQPRYLLVVAGGPANKEVRFYRSPPLTAPDALDPNSWSPVGRYSDVQLTLCLGGQYAQDSNGFTYVVGPSWPIGTGWFDTGQHQMLNLVREGSLDGQLYLFGGRRDGAVVNPFANEYLDLYQVNLTADGVPDTCPISTVTNGVRQMGEASWGEAFDSGTFSAASGMYVSPTGEIMVYEAPHANSNVILFGEFRALNVVRASSPTLHPSAHVDGPVEVNEGTLVQMTGHGEQAATKAFVSLFQDDGAGVSFSDPVWFQIDYEDWAAIGSENLQLSVRYLLDINGIPFLSHLIWEKASSWRWFAPPGCTIAATDYPITSNAWPGPDTVLLPGTGQVESAADLEHLSTYKPDGETWKWSPAPAGVTPSYVNYDNDIEGISFTKPYPNGNSAVKQLGCDNYYSATIGLAWDLDNNGTYEVTGTSAYFSATQLDGPSTATVTARAQHPTDTSDLGTGAPFSFPVTVRNVAPIVPSAAIADSLGHDLTASGAIAIVGLTVSLSVDFTDPGLADTQTGAVDWGDGSALDTTFATFTDAHGGATGHLRDAHVFTAAGAHTISATITDDDGGATSASGTIQVMSLADAINATAQTLTQLIASTTNPQVARALRKARDELIGNHGGQPPTNGALDKLDANDPGGAITKLQAALSDLIDAESYGAGDLTTLKDLIGLIAEGIANDVYQKVRAAFPSPSPGQAKALATVAALIAQGHQQLLSHQYLPACDSLRQAVTKALGIK